MSEVEYLELSRVVYARKEAQRLPELTGFQEPGSSGQLLRLGFQYWVLAGARNIGVGVQCLCAAEADALLAAAAALPSLTGAVGSVSPRAVGIV